MASKECCIIVITYNAENWIDKCFSGFSNMPENWEVLAIDNDSKDNTIKSLKEKYPFVKTIQNNKNLGFGGANNIGLKYALDNNFEHILLLNQDAWISIDGLKKLIDLQKQNPEYYVLSPLHGSGSEDSLDYNFVNYMKNSSEKALIEDSLLGKYKKDIYDCKFCNAAIWLISHQCLKGIGGFSPTFFHYGEDNNYLDRLLFHGKKLGIVPSVKGHHERNQRKPSKIFGTQKAEQYRYYLIKLSTPQVNEYKYLCKLFFCSISYFCRFKLQKSYMYFSNLLKILAQKRIIDKNRKISMQQGASFLN